MRGSGRQLTQTNYLTATILQIVTTKHYGKITQKVLLFRQSVVCSNFSRMIRCSLWFVLYAMEISLTKHLCFGSLVDDIHSYVVTLSGMLPYTNITDKIYMTYT